MTVAVLSTVKSPCTSVCQMHEPTGWCQGCARTIPEITGWACADDTSRLLVLARLPERRSVLIEQGIFTAAEPESTP